MSKQASYSIDLSKLLAGICQVPAVLDTLIHGVQVDSRLVKKGDLFIALSGARFPAEAHIDEAISRGANAVLVEGNVHTGKVHESGDAVELYLPELRSVTGKIADRFFRSPSKDLRVIGVTGTNGKTSVSSYTAQLLSANGIRAGVLGTLGYGEPRSEAGLTPLSHTTPNVVDVHRYLAQLRDSGLQAVVMEVSSHGLEQGRVDQVSFEAAVFTNLTRDHLDYHGSMEAYGAAKARLFEKAELKFAVLNQEDPFSSTLEKRLTHNAKVYSYGEHASATVFVRNVDYGTGLHADVRCMGETIALTSQLVGRFNLYNLLAAVSVCVGMGCQFTALHGIENVQAAPGRMNIFHRDRYPTVVIDYAHTPDALKNILDAVRQHCSGRLVLVFGCGGDRDRGKRPEMALIAERLADQVYVTDDNPRNEDPDAIVREILQGFDVPARVKVVHDRREAVREAIASAGDNDWVLIAGKGHEDYQEIQEQRVHLSDLELTREFLGLSVQSEVHGD